MHDSLSNAFEGGGRNKDILNHKGKGRGKGKLRGTGAQQLDDCLKNMHSSINSLRQTTSNLDSGNDLTLSGNDRSDASEDVSIFMR